MNRWMQMLMRLIDRENGRNADERYLARSVDAQDFETRIQTLERACH